MIRTIFPFLCYTIAIICFSMILGLHVRDHIPSEREYISRSLADVAALCNGRQVNIHDQTDSVTSIIQCDKKLRFNVQQQYPGCVDDIDSGDLFLAVAGAYNPGNDFSQVVDTTAALICK